MAKKKKSFLDEVLDYGKEDKKKKKQSFLDEVLNYKRPEQPTQTDIAPIKTQQTIQSPSTTVNTTPSSNILMPNTTMSSTKPTSSVVGPVGPVPINRNETVSKNILMPEEIKSQNNIKTQQENITKGRKNESGKNNKNNIVSTAANTLKIFGQGMMKAEEAAFIDTPVAIVSGLTGVSNKILTGTVDLFSKVGVIDRDYAKEYIDIKNQQTQATQQRLNEFVANDLTANALDYYGWNDKLNNGKTIEQTLEDNSVIKSTNLGGKVVEGLGGMAPSILLGSLGGDLAGLTQNGKIVNATKEAMDKLKKVQSLISYSSLGARSFGGAYEEAINNGATTGQATAYGLSSAAVEIGTEWLSGGVPGLKGTAGGGLDSLFEEHILKDGLEATSKSLSKAIVKALYKTSMEGVEESISQTLEPFIKQFTYQYDESKGFGGNLKEAASKVSAKDILEAGIVGALTAVALGDVEISDLKSGYQNSQIINNTINETISSQENMLGRELTNDEKAQIKTAVNEEFDNINQFGEEKANRIKEVRNGASSEGLNLVESYKAYHGDDGNLSKVQETQTMYDKRGIDARVDATQFKNSKEVSFWETRDGKQYVVINPNADSNAIFQDAAVHELAHDVFSQNTKLGKSIKNDVLEHVKNDKQYNELRTEIEEKYKDIYTKDENYEAKIDEEVVAKYLGTNLGTQEYISRLVGEKPNIAQRIYNWVKDKLDNIGKTKEQKQEKEYWKSVADKFEEAYNEQKKLIKDNDTRYLSVGIKEINKTLKRKDLTNAQKNILNKIFNNYQEALNNYNGENNELVRKDYGWYKDPSGNWHFEITDKYATFNLEPQKNHTYKLGELLNHKLLYDIDPTLKNVKVSFTDLDTAGRYRNLPGFRDIKINNNLIEKGTDRIKSTLIHEIQHKLQNVNKFEGGTTSGTTLDEMIEYVNNLGEIEATDSSKRMNLTQKQLKEITPELAKEKPKHPNEESLINKREKQIEKRNKKKYNKSRWFSEEVIDETQDENNNINKGNGLRTDNSSFSLQEKINSSMTMNEAKKMIDIAFKENQINDWMDDNEKYRDAHDWLNKVGTDEVAMYIENGYSTIENYLNPLYERDNSFGEDYVLEDIIEAYKNGTLTGGTKLQANRLDLTKTSNKKDNRFYSPQTINNIEEVYSKANERVTNSKKDEVYKARGQFVILAHNQENIDNLGLNRQELNKKLKSWAAYSNKALELSNRLNANVDRNNQWAGLENSSIINTASISNEELSSLVKNIEGDSSNWQRHYITSTMLALDTHIDYKDLSFQFDASNELNEKNALGDYSRKTKTIRIGRGYQNTVAHEMGHYLDNKWAEDFGFFSTANMTDNLNFKDANVSEDVKQFAKNFKIFMDDLVKNATSESSNNVAYYQDRSEVFARFVGRFVEWTKNTASDGRFGYEDKFYKDNFTQSQYEEFVKLLQEKSMLDSTGQTYSSYSSISNEDIRYEAKTTDIAPVTKGTRTTMGELFNQNIAPIREDISNLTKQVENLSKQLETTQKRTEIAPTGYVEEYKEGRNENRNSRPLTEEDANLYQESLMNNEDYLRSLDEQANATENNLKLINRTTNEVQQKLGLSKNEKSKLENIVRKAVENNMTTDEIANELSNEFSSIEYTTPNYEAREVKKLIKSTPLKVSDAIKKDIADYGDFQRRNFNKISISKNGIPVDVAYESLTQQNPGYFPSDIINPTDQLLRIVEVANFTNDLTETYEFSQDDIDDAADYITNNILEDRYNSQMSADADLQKGIEFNFDNEIAPTTIRSQESIDNTIENRDIAPVREEQPFRQTLKGEEKKAQRKINLENTWRKFQETAVNRNYVIDKLAKATGNDDIKFTGDMLNSYSGEVNFNVNNWQTNMKGEEVGKSIKDIFEPAKKTGLYAPFNDYLIQKSNIERHAVGKGSQIPLVVSQQLVAQYETEYPQFKEWSKDVFKYLDNVLQDQVDYGIITQEQYDNYRGENGIYRSYVPFYEANYDAKRYFDDNGEVKPVSTLKRSKGGAKDTSSMLAVEDALVRQTFAYKQAIRQNELLKEIVKTHEKYDNMMDLDTRLNPTDLNDSLYTTEDGDKIVTAYINGERVSAKVSDELFNELTRENENRVKQFEEDFSIVTKPIQKISSIRRNLLTTWNPTFLARNAIKDIQDAVINSKHTAGMLKNYMPGIKELTQAKTKEAKQFLALYGSENLYGDYSNVSNSKKLANKIIRANEIIELAPRFAEFKASLQAGESLEQAMYNAREVTTNFGRGGYITKALNRNGFTFLNANVQGLDKAIRNLTGQNGVKGVTAMVVKGAIFSILPSLLNDMLYGGDDDKDEEYEALSTYIKDNYYLIKLENGNFLRIPKGRLSAAFGSGARRLEELSKGDKDALKGWASNAWEQIGVGDLGGNNILAPIKQAFGSKNGTAWYGGDIVPTRLQKKPNAEQSDEKTDAISKFLGETLGISPKKINYVFDQYSGGLGDIFLPMITPASSNGADSLGEYLLAPIKDSFVVNSTDDNKYAGKFYDKSDELQIKANSDYATDEDKLKSKYMSDISSEMTKLYTEKREIQMDNSLSKKEKYAKVQVIQNEINNTAKKAMDNYEKVNQTDGYANVGGNEYYKNANDKWATVSESDAEFTAGLSDKEKSYYYDTKNKIYNIKSDYNKNVEGVTDSSIKNKYYSEKKKNITNAIKNSGLNDYTKAMLYGNNYLGKEKMNNVYNAGYDIDDYITAMYKIEQIRDKYSKNNGYTTQQRKQKTIAYINSLNMNVPEKAMLIRQYYTSFRDYNKKIVNYVADLDLTYEEKIAILNDTGMSVKGNRVTWK